MERIRLSESDLHRIVNESVNIILSEIDYSKHHEDIDVYYNGEPFYGEATFINGYNGYESSDTDGYLCALLIDRNGNLSPFNNDGKPNYITNKAGVPIRLKNRRGTRCKLNGKLSVSYEDRMAHGYFNAEYSPEDYGMETYETGVFESKTKNNNMNKKLIRLTESDLHKIVKESVNRILKEDILPNGQGTDWDEPSDYDNRPEEGSIGEYVEQKMYKIIELVYNAQEEFGKLAEEMKEEYPSMRKDYGALYNDFRKLMSNLKKADPTQLY